jgi:dethiobiotin synthetase
MANSIMLMGTSSHVGKSIITTALCRIFHQEGRKVVPFKAQNMALNSYVTKDGREMGRAQVAQAEAAGLEPMVDMNPVLLKPTGNSCSQVVINGKAVGNMSAREYHKGYSLKAFGAVTEALARLQKDFDTLVIEGAGSPAEVNLKANDIVNMRVAKHLNAPVLLIADIDRGGALASLVGTLELLDEDERALVKGLIINKFRGDVTLRTPAVDFLEEKTGKPVLGEMIFRNSGYCERFKVHISKNTYGWIAPYVKGVPEKWPVDYGYLQAYETVVEDGGETITEVSGFVVVVTEIAGGSTAVPDTWPSRFPSYTAKFGSDFTASLTKPTGKKDAAGNDLQVWQDYVAGTDPTDVNDVFRATVTMSGNTPVVSWTPVLPAAEAAKRTYTILGRQSLLTGDWTVVPSGQEANYNFFKVTVKMK